MMNMSFEVYCGSIRDFWRNRLLLPERAGFVGVLVGFFYLVAALAFVVLKTCREIGGCEGFFFCLVVFYPISLSFSPLELILEKQASFFCFMTQDSKYTNACEFHPARLCTRGNQAVIRAAIFVRLFDALSGVACTCIHLNPQPFPPLSSLPFLPDNSGMPCLTTSLYEGGYCKCDVNYHLNRVMEELKPILCTWTGAQGMNRHVAMPHLNTYYRYREIQRSDGEWRRPKGGRISCRGIWWGGVVGGFFVFG